MYQSWKEEDTEKYLRIRRRIEKLFVNSILHAIIKYYWLINSLTRKQITTTHDSTIRLTDPLIN
ncbi:hypothetical protein HanHA300_Chr16g0628821 [Helianthus annuus]|nr:hypothetical protein HanHA300_Chr16g0628821 [Helianthus annuus]KAJ0444939.1 hypothetical protein HanIR_Chr16g0837491 [Helianthus annuus]KAJ0462135.1 hypothetical protein HanHA89_Chr16g0680141 [Helianthus annuus]KAJ0642520.1 hypothetical protein HanLR1_Chr16g0639351 [Helianthus annuus]KAJ0646395.1 hypothetical protein HanOQP8_Chr16g0634791 [Helianthus annuus]